MRRAKLFSKLHGPGLSVFDQTLVSAANFITILLLARAMAPTGFGVFMVAYTGLLVLSGLQNAFVIQPHHYIGAPLDEKEFAQFNGSVLLMQTITGAWVCLLLALAAGAVVALGFRQHGYVVAVLALVAFPSLIQQFIRRAFYTKGKIKSAAANNAVCSGLQLAGVVWIVNGSPEPSAESVLLVYGGSSFVAALLGFFQMRVSLDFSGGFSVLAETSGKVWNFGKWLVAQNMVSWFGMCGDTWLIAGMLGAEAAGTYRAVVHLAGVLNPLRQAAAAYLPARARLTFHHGGHVSLARWVKRTMLVLLFAILPIALVMIIFSGAILGLAYGSKFADYEVLLALGVVAVVVEFLRYPIGIAILAMLSARVMFMVHLIPALLLPTLGVLLVWLFGVFGVPWFHIVAACSTLVATFLIYRKQMRRDQPVIADAEWEPSRSR